MRDRERRLTAIRAVVARGAVRTQGDLSSHLAKSGFEVSQSTLWFAKIESTRRHD